MNDRSDAISVLQQAREVLAQRLTERILESRQEIIDDAEGLSFLSEIETLYDQLGSRLAHVNTMLSNLPPVTEGRSSDVSVSEPIYVDTGSNYPMSFETDSTPLMAPLALPAPDVIESRHVAAAPTTFQAFAAQIQAGDISGAGASLAELFGVDAACGERCAEVFAERLATQPDLFLRATQLRMELATGSLNGPLMLLWECFGLSGIESLGVLHNLKARFGKSGKD